MYVENVVHGHICADKTLSTKEGAKASGGKVCSYYWMATSNLYYELSWHIQNCQAYFITNMEPMNMWDFVYMIQAELGYNRWWYMDLSLSLNKWPIFIVCKSFQLCMKILAPVCGIHFTTPCYIIFI